MSSSTKAPRVLVLAGDGINCEEETAEAFRMARFEPEIRHLNDLIEEKVSVETLLENHSCVAIPGGFSFGDDLGSGKILALKIQFQLRWNLNQYAQQGGMVLGVCNGFQALIKMGVFGTGVSITHNSGGKFMNHWTRVSPKGSQCLWLKGLGTIDLPIRHQEGRIIFGRAHKSEVLEKMKRNGMNCLTYEENINGSEEDLAGLCDSTGRILGLMPHPEAFIRWTQHPDWTKQSSRAHSIGHGLAIFENAYEEAMRTKSQW